MTMTTREVLVARVLAGGYEREWVESCDDDELIEMVAVIARDKGWNDAIEFAKIKVAS
jgi:hypothetical protein